MSKYVDLDKAITIFDTRGRKIITTVFQILDGNGAVYETADVVERELYQRALSDVVRLSVERPERKHGKWIQHVGEDTEYHCSECKRIHYFWNTKINFCPNCGADMRGDNDV